MIGNGRTTIVDEHETLYRELQLIKDWLDLAMKIFETASCQDIDTCGSHMRDHARKLINTLEEC